MKSQELRDGSVWDTHERISDLGLAKSSAKLYPPDTVLVAMYGATVGQLGYLRVGAAVNQAICGLVVDRELADPRFVYYALREARRDLVAGAAGAAQQNLNQGQIRTFSIRVPSATTQRRIASILGAIDDLTENNLRRIALLEQMAQAIYREWFVHLRYPGHEDDELVDSRLGTVPAAWQFSPLDAVAQLHRVNVLPSRHPEISFEHFSIPNFDDHRMPSMDLGDSIRSGKYGVAAPSVLVSKLNPLIQRVWLAEPNSETTAVASTEFMVLRPKEWPLEFLYLVLCSSPFHEQVIGLASGTSNSHQRAKPADFMELNVVEPTRELVERASLVVAPMIRTTGALRKQAAATAKLRDRLLPKLVTGAIDVSKLDLDALLEESAA